METNLPTLAGLISTALFVLGALPMLAKAFRTKDPASCSLGNILLSNVGNIIDWIGLSLNLIFWVGLVAGLTLLVVWAIRRTRVAVAPGPYASEQPTAQAILQARYAKGEITREQHVFMQRDLEKSFGSRKGESAP